jgi:hypothetical protein
MNMEGRTFPLKAYTDYPIKELGDVGGHTAPMRACIVLSYDGNKYCRVLVEGHEVEIKGGYIYEVRP